MLIITYPNNKQQIRKTSMNSKVVSIFLFWLILAGQSALAVDANRIWLPKKYNSVKPKLMAAAIEAEKTDRCVKVIAGEMITRKNTEDHFYFMITCRDQNRITYNLTYLYPKEGYKAELVSEQNPSNAIKQEEVEITEAGVDKEQVLVLCKNEFITATDTLDNIVVLENLLAEVRGEDRGFSYNIPFTALSEFGSPARYRAECNVSHEGKATIDIFLTGEGALVVCKDSLRAESILLGRSTVVEEGITAIPTIDNSFHFKIPFDAKTRGSAPLSYSADCRVQADGDSDIVMSLLPAGALVLCKDSLRMETFLLKGVEIDDEALNLSEQEGLFYLELAFTANDPEGKKRNFKGICNIDEESEAYVEIFIDKGAIVSVCLKDLKDSTTKMLDIVVLEDQIPELTEDGEGYLSVIPFNAKNPSGTELHYKAECRVDGSGRGKIKIKARRD